MISSSKCWSGGLLAGVMYSLVAIGFVLIYKASGVFNFAQGAMVLFAALTFVSLVERGVAPWLAFVVTLAVMVLIGVAIERARAAAAGESAADRTVHGDAGLELRPRRRRATVLGRAGAWSRSRHRRHAARASAVRPDQPVRSVRGGDRRRAGGRRCRFFTQRTRIGLSLRAVADDPLAALAVGMRLPRIWAIVWALAGFVSLVAGLLWGARLGVQFSLSLVVLKALPVLIIGGFSSIAGAIVGGLLIGAVGEARRSLRRRPFVGGGIENWFPYVLAMLFLLVRPAGLFGEPRRRAGVRTAMSIRRQRRRDHAARLHRPAAIAGAELWSRRSSR